MSETFYADLSASINGSQEENSGKTILRLLEDLTAQGEAVITSEDAKYGLAYVMNMPPSLFDANQVPFETRQKLLKAWEIIAKDPKVILFEGKMATLRDFITIYWFIKPLTGFYIF